MESQQNIDLFIGFTWVLICALGIIMTVYYYNYSTRLLKSEKEKQLIAFRASVEAEEKEKEKIARNLHDEVIPVLTISGRSIEDYISTFKEPNDIPQSLINAKELINQGISGIRDISLDIIPNTFLNFGLIKALEQYVNKLNSSDESDVELANNTKFENEIPFSKNEQINIYRICLELLTNLYKHAQYTYLRVTIDKTDNLFLVKLEHDGKGVNNEDIKIFSQSSVGLGLRSLESRLLILSATVNYSIGVDTSKIILSIPFTA